jgi:hypothetical protein
VERSIPRRQRNVAGPSEWWKNRRRCGRAGFSTNLTLTTTGNKRSVSIVSEGDIRNVSIAMMKS